MADKPEVIGVLLVHGMGEQKPFEHLRHSAKELASSIASTPGLIRLSVAEDIEEDIKTSGSIAIEGIFNRDGGERHVRIDLHEVYWADLGISGSLLEQAKFWFWGLGQWAAEAVLTGNPRRNTVKLMTNPRFAHQKDPMERPSLLRQLPSRAMLFAAGLLAILTFFTWSAAKRIVAFLSRTLPEPSLIFLFLGDVKIYQQSGAAGKGSLLDPDLPIRATIRRRMVRALTAMAARGYDRWYISAHSLGTIPAFNALQETELALPNYLGKAEWDALPAALKTDKPFKPKGEEPTTNDMMPRRPPWLEDKDGIDRTKLFERLAGFVTYGCPLDKFAALWPRVVVLNRQAAVFPERCEWVNLHDPTDPVAARLDAFAPPQNRADEDGGGRIALEPKNFPCRSSWIFGLSHIRYFHPRRRAAGTMPAVIAEALIEDKSLVRAASKAALSPAAAWGRALAALLQLVVLALALIVAAAALLLAIGKALPDRAASWIRETIEAICPALAAMLRDGLWCSLLASAAVVFLLALFAVLACGLTRMAVDAFKPRRR